MKKLFAAASLVAVASCATPPEEIPAAYVSPIQYQAYTCSQLSQEVARVSRRVSELHGGLKKTAENDSAQMGVGLILFFPALFFLEGGDGPQAAEYARLKGERDALEVVSIQKDCGIKFQEVKETKTEPKEEPKTNW